MNSKSQEKYLFSILFLILFLSVSMISMDNVSAADTLLYVNGTSGDDKYDGTSPLVIDENIGPKKYIQSALDAVGDDGIVNVAEGTYQESLIINRNVMLNGSGSSKTELIPAYDGDNVITINSGVNKATVNCFTITGATNGVGIANKGTGVTISNNNITGNGNGIVAADISESFITGNIIAKNGLGLNIESDSTVLRFNRIIENDEAIRTLVTVDAANNWWGSNRAPEIENVKNSPWLYMTFMPDPTIVLNGGNGQLIASFNNEYDGQDVTPFDPSVIGHLADDSQVEFTTNLGSLGTSGIKKVNQTTINGLTTVTFIADEGTGTAKVYAVADNEKLGKNVEIINNLYVNGATGNDSWSGTSPTFISGTTGPLKTIQTAINKINSGGTIEIAPGTYNEHLTIAKSMTINGTSRTNTFINGTNTGRTISIFGSSTVININHLTLQNGTESSGGAIYNWGTVNITDSTISGNSASYSGGAIYNWGTVNISGSTLSGNSASDGGAIYNDGDLNGGNVHITDSSISGNSASYYGGAILNGEGGSVFVYDSTLNGNNANSKGGAIHNLRGSVFISGSTLSGNSANYGGAIYNLVTVNIDDSTISGNTASTFGGAIYNLGTVNITDSTISGNNASSGGAIHSAGTLNIDDSIISGNRATYHGGAIHSAGTVNIDDSIISGNRATSYGGAIYTFATVFISGSTLSGNNAYYGGAIFNLGSCTVNFNRIVDNTPTIAIYNGEGFSVDAKNNWWGSNDNPSGKVSAGVDVSKWLVLRSTAYPTIIGNNSSSIITVDLQHDNGILMDPTHPDLYYHNPAMGHVPDGVLVTFSTTMGTIMSPSSMVNGIAQSTLNGGTVPGMANISSTLDSETVHSSVEVDKTAPTAWANLSSGLYNVNKLVSLFMSESGSIYYTTNGLNPSISSAKFISPILIASSTVLKFFAIDAAGNPSSVYTATYNIDKIVPKIIYTYPKNSATRISRTATLYFKFSENIKASSYWSKIYVKNLKTGKKVSIRKWISGRTLYIKITSKRSAYTWYRIYIPYKAVKDYAGNNLPTSRIIKFKTGR